MNDDLLVICDDDDDGMELQWWQRLSRCNGLKVVMMMLSGLAPCDAP